MLPGDEEEWNKRKDGQGQHWTQHKHGYDRERGSQSHAQDRRKVISTEVGHLFDWFFEGIHHRPGQCALVIVVRVLVQVAQYIHTKPNRHFLPRVQGYVVTYS